MLSPWRSGRPDEPPSGFEPLARSLRYQARRLGLTTEAATGAHRSRGSPAWAFEVVAPGVASPVEVLIDAWADGRDAPASEFLVQAASGLMAVHGRSSGGSQALGVDFISTATAALALQGAMGIALGRLRGAAHAQVRMSLAGSALLCLGQYIADATAPEMPERMAPGSQSPLDRPPFVSVDGVVFELESLDAAPWRTFWASVGVDAAVAAQGWKAFLLRYARATSPMPVQMMHNLATLTFADIAVRCEQAGLHLVAMRTLAERSGDADARVLWQSGPWRFATVPSATANRADAAGDALPLSGLTVVESCRRIQGPLAGHLLALMGANVIRIEPPGGDTLRGMPPMAGNVSARFDALNRLKTVQEIDIKSVAGRQAVLELVRDADVFLHNWAPGKAAELGLDDADLAQANPSLMYAHAGSWGNARVAPDLPGTDFTTQAYSGVASTIARASGTRGGSLFTALDVLGGIVAAQGVTAALLRWHGQAVRCRVDTSLLGGATLLCAAELSGEPAAQPAVLQAVHATQDGRLALECPDAAALRRLAEAVDLRSSASLQTVRNALPAWLAEHTTRDAGRLLTAIGVPCSPVAEDLAALPQDPRLAGALRPADYVQVESPWRWS